MKTTIHSLLALMLLLVAPAGVKAQTGSGDGYNYSINASNANTITLTGYTGPGGAVTVPSNINGLIVTVIGKGALPPASVFVGAGVTSVTIPNSVTSLGRFSFFDCTNLTSVTIPNSLTNIPTGVFSSCSSLVGVYFLGNAPTADSSVFSGDPTVKAYYLPGTTGWTTFTTSTGVPAILWNPLIQASGANFGVRSNQFGFNITNSANLTVVVEACANLAYPAWVPLTTNMLTNGSFFFSEPVQTNSSARFYGLGVP